MKVVSPFIGRAMKQRFQHVIESKVLFVNSAMPQAQPEWQLVPSGAPCAPPELPGGQAPLHARRGSDGSASMSQHCFS